MVMQVRHSEPSGRVTLLDLDPDLGEMLAGDRADAARAELHVHVIEVSRGPWRPAALLPPNRANLGMLIVEGAAWRELSTHGDASAELLGPGDLVRTWHEDDQADSTRWDSSSTPTTGRSSMPCPMPRLPSEKTVVGKGGKCPLR